VGFKLFSREGCLLHETVVQVHAGYPYRLFKLLLFPDMAGDIQGDCPKMRDKYSQSFIDFYQPDLLSDAALSELLAVATVTKTSTARLESLHAMIARLLQANFRQVAKPGIGVVSADYVLGRLRRRERESVDPVGSSAYLVRKNKGQKGKLRQVTRKGRAKRYGGGGAWRAFLSMRLKGQQHPRITQELAQEYQLLSAEHKKQLQHEGHTATAVRRAGALGFGVGAKAQRRLAKEALREARALQLLKAVCG
jgi:hypothetical protein